MKNLMLLLLLSAFAFSVPAQKVNLAEVCKLDKALHETSGLVVSGGKIWSHNDSGGQPVLYGFDNTCKVTDIVYVSAKNVDWEELAKDDAGNIYIGDFGNSHNKRHDMKILRIADPSTAKDNIAKPEIIQFKFSDQKLFPPGPEGLHYDVEAMIWFDNNLYLFSKNRTEPFTGYCRVYRLPAKPGTHIAELVDSVYLGPAPMIANWVTGADISPDKKKLILLSHDKMWVFTCFEGDKFFTGEKHVFNFPTLTQKEAVCFINDKEIYITDEIVMKVTGGRLYNLNLNELKIKACP